MTTATQTTQSPCIPQNDAPLPLARFWGGLCVFLPTMFLLRPDVLTELRRLVEGDRAFSMAYALLSLLVGLATLSLHNRWRLRWTTTISVFGWLCILKAFMLLAFNSLKVKLIPSFSDRLFATQALLGLVLILGGWVLFRSYQRSGNVPPSIQ